MNKYKEINGTSYSENTSDKVIKVLEKCIKERIRIVVDYGDVKTGISWNECHDICGYIGRSSGKIKIPLLIYNSRSFGGGALLDNCIVKITTSKGKRILYQHSTSCKWE